VLPEEIGFCSIDDFVAAAAEHGLEHEEAEAFTCSRVIVGGIESSWRFTRTSTSAGPSWRRASAIIEGTCSGVSARSPRIPAASAGNGKPSRKMSFRAGGEGGSFFMSNVNPWNLLGCANGIGDAVE
jgi:hypothetical protein